MKKIAVGLQKGGTGKTTTTLCLGRGLAERKRRVLLIDLDPQANLTTAAGIDPVTLEGPSIYECLTNPETTLSEAIFETDYGFDVAPATIALSLAEKHLMTAMNRDRKLYRKLSDLEKQSRQNAQLAYDYVLIDCPPSLGILTVNALAAADFALVPLQAQQFAAYGLNYFLDTMNEVRAEFNEQLSLLGVVLTMYNARTKVSQDVANEMREALGDRVFDTIIRTATILGEVATRGPVQAYSPRSEAASEYNRLAEEVIRRAEKS
jgi:chromosome partitioning protein